MFPIPLHIYFELAALTLSIIFWKRINQGPLKWFFPYLVLIVAVELTGRYIRRELHQPNVWLYNLSIPLEYLFQGFVFYSFFKNISNHYLAKWFLFLFFCFVV